MTEQNHQPELNLIASGAAAEKRISGDGTYRTMLRNWQGILARRDIDVYRLEAKGRPITDHPFTANAEQIVYAAHVLQWENHDLAQDDLFSSFMNYEFWRQVYDDCIRDPDSKHTERALELKSEAALGFDEALRQANSKKTEQE